MIDRCLSLYGCCLLVTKYWSSKPKKTCPLVRQVGCRGWSRYGLWWESLQSALAAAVDCVCFLLVDFWVFVRCNLFYFSLLTLVSSLLCRLQQGRCERTQRAVSCLHEPHWCKCDELGHEMNGISVLSARRSPFLEAASGCCFVAVDDARSPQRTRYQNNTLKTGGRINKQCKGAKSGMFVLLWTVSRSNCFLNCFQDRARGLQT